MAIWSTANSIQCTESVVATRYFTSLVLIFLFMQIRVCTIIYDILTDILLSQADIAYKYKLYLLSVFIINDYRYVY